MADDEDALGVDDRMLPKNPAGSVYRHVALLLKAGVLQVVAERRVRAMVERTYSLRLYAAQIQPDEVAVMTPEQHGRAFMAYIAGLLADADRYLTSGSVDPIRDGADYRMGAMWLTDAEWAEFLRDFRNVFRPRLANVPGKRRRRMVDTVFLPAPDKRAGDTVEVPRPHGVPGGPSTSTSRTGR